jgi:hypothetical protein
MDEKPKETWIGHLCNAWMAALPPTFGLAVLAIVPGYLGIWLDRPWLVTLATFMATPLFVLLLPAFALGSLVALLSLTLSIWAEISDRLKKRKST